MITNTEYDFTLILSGVSELSDAIANAVYAVCDDALLATSGGVASLDFTRPAATMKDAILAAIADVRQVGRGIDVLRIDCSTLLTQAEIARKLGKSRAAVSQYIGGSRGPGGFPPPVNARSNGATGQPLWQWCDVAAWLCRHDLAPRSLVEDAEAVEAINCMLAYHRQSKRHAQLARKVRALMAGKRTA